MTNTPNPQANTLDEKKYPKARLTFSDVVKYIMLQMNCGYAEAAQMLDKAIEPQITKARISQTNDLNTKIFHTYANPTGQYIKDLLMTELTQLKENK